MDSKDAGDAASSWTFGVLGPVFARREGAPIQLGGVKQRALLAFLVLHVNRPVSTGAIMRALWGDEPPPTAAKGIQVAVSRLRQEMGPDAKAVLVTTRDGYLLKTAEDSIDVARAAAAARAGDMTDPARAAEQARDALALWRGAPLADVASEPFAAAAAARLEDLRLTLLDARFSAELELGRHAQIVGELREVCHAYPLSEQLHEHLALALYRTGRQAEALDALRELRGSLADELGLDPTPRMHAFEERILRHDPTLLPPTPAEARTPAPVHDAGTNPRIGSRKRRLWLIAGAVGAVIAVTLTLTLSGTSTAHHSGSTNARVQGDSVAILGGDGTDVLADLPVGSSPGAVAIAGDYIWVADANDHTVAQIDATTHRLVRIYGMSAAPVSLTPLGDKIWVGNAFAGTLARILVPAQQVSAPFFPQKRVTGLLAIAAAPDGLWVGLADRSLIRLDPDNLRVTKSITTPLRVLAIASSGSALWTIPFFGAQVDRISAAGDRATTLARIAGHPNAIAAGDGWVWVTTVSPNALLRIDPQSGKVISYSAEHAPSGIAVGTDAVWIAEASAGVVERFPIRGALHSQINLGFRIGGVAASGSDVYLTLDDRI